MRRIQTNKTTKKAILLKRVNKNLQEKYTRPHTYSAQDSEIQVSSCSINNEYDSSKNLQGPSCRSQFINDDFNYNFSTVPDTLNSISETMSDSDQLINDDFESDFFTTSDALSSTSDMISS
ncbi:29792_t:CDS:1, partial [Gigaspora margarita]